MHPSKRKGNSAELEIAGILSDLLGYKVKRRYNIGTHEDIGDLIGLPDCTAQVKNFADIARAIREAVDQLEDQRSNAGTTFAVAFIRRPGGRWIAVQTIEGFCTTLREATA